MRNPVYLHSGAEAGVRDLHHGQKPAGGIKIMIRYMKQSLTLRDNSEELLSEDSGGLPFVCHYDESRLFAGNHIPWH